MQQGHPRRRCVVLDISDEKGKKMIEAIFWGAGGQARVLKECLIGTNIRLAALFDNDTQLKSPFAHVPLYYGEKGFFQWLSMRSGQSPASFLVAIGGERGRIRFEIYRFLLSHGLTPLTVRHRTSFVSANAQIGAGSQILAQAAIGVDAVIGRACIINTAATVDHECTLGDGVHVCPGAHLAGCVNVGDFATIGTGAVVIPRISIAEGAVIGGGAVVIRDVPPHAVVVGNPGRIISYRRKDNDHESIQS